MLNKLYLILFLICLTCFIIKIIFDYIKTPKSIIYTVNSPQKIISSSIPRPRVKVDILNSGSGKEAVKAKIVRVHYTAWLTSGVKVDSSHDEGAIFTFKLGNREVIAGWEAGMLRMLEGEIRKFTIEPELAYGVSG
jgi:FKBP-type peptidyl-prolyl cis-trans isomerase